MSEKLTGLIAATCTPMKPNADINLDVIPAYADTLSADGVRGVFPCGSTGESSSLTVAERKAVTREWISASKKRLAVIAHVGHTCVKDSQALAEDAQAAGATAVAALAPYYFKPTDLDTLIDFCAEVASAAPKLPFYYYHMPGLTGVNIKVAEFLARGAERIPTLAGAKYTHEDGADLIDCLRLDNGRYQMFFGRDEMLLSALATGATAAVGSTYNFLAPMYNKMIAAVKAGDLAAAQEHQYKAVKIIQCMVRAGALSAFKASMKMVGIDCGPIRLPLRTLSGEALRTYERELRAAGFFDVIQKR